MQRNISRRDFGKRLAGGAALLALQPAWTYPAAAQSLRNDLKDLSGELSFDEAALQTASDDFGHVVHKKPMAMLRPRDAQDIAKLVQFANRQGLKVAMRGQGHSFFGQTQVAGGVVVDSSSLNAIRIVRSGTGVIAEIGAGSKWHPVLMAANAQKLTVPVTTDTFLSVGGTISTGGFGVTTYNLGLQVDHVQELEAVTGDGQIVTCSDERNSDLFNAMLGGLGQCGIITRVMMRLMDAPTNVLFIKMDYDDFQSASADLALLAKDGRFHHLDGRGASRPTGGVGYYIEGANLSPALLDVSRRGNAEIDKGFLQRRRAQRAHFLATEILLVGHDCGGLFRELESRGQLRLVGIVWCVIEGTAFDVVSHAAGRSAGAAAVQVMEPSILGKQREIRRRALEVVIVHFYEQHIRGRVHQPHHDFGDDAALTEAPEQGVEEIAVTLIGACHDLPVAGHHLKLLHVINLKTKVVGRYAKSAGADRSADRQKRIGDHRYRQFLGVR